MKASAEAHALQLDVTDLPKLGTSCVIIGHARQADVVWTRDEFMTICDHMLNGNPPTDFLLVYRDALSQAKFAKSKTARAGRRASWAWDTITSRAKSKVGIGFYPTNPDGNSRWGAMDFDAHDGNSLRARGFAMASFELLHRHPQLYIVLGTSGSEGWHLFAFTNDFHPVAEWTRLLKDVAQKIGAPIQKGACEVFPNETRGNALPTGIRAPRTWNPKTDALGLIAFEGVGPLLVLKKKEKESNAFLYHSKARVETTDWNDRGKKVGVSAIQITEGDFPIVTPATRAEQLKALTLACFPHFGKSVAKELAHKQYLGKTVVTDATLADHEAEFDTLWQWRQQKWVKDLTEQEQSVFESLIGQNQRDVFRIAHNFSRKARLDGLVDFPFPVEEVGARIGKRFQTVSEIRKRFVSEGIILLTASHVTNVRAARYRWTADKQIEEPF